MTSRPISEFNPSSANQLIFIAGSVLIVTIALSSIIPSLGFFVNRGVSSWDFPASFVLAGTIYYAAFKDKLRDIAVFIKAIVLAVTIIILSIVVATFFYDVSYDGQTYHMEAIYQLKNGWNPFYTLLPKQNHLTIYINHYAKGAELPQSTIYSLTNYIESGKATNFILLAGTFCICLSFLLSLKKLSPVKCTVITILLVLNPVVVNQLISTYVDGQLALLLLAFIVMAVWIVRDHSYYNNIVLGAIIIITVNVKFTGLIYVVIFSVAFLAWLLFTKNNKLFKKVLLATAVSGLIAVLIVGYNPYVVNTVQFMHPFYPLMGQNKVDIMGYNLPNGFEGKNAINKLFMSLFAHTDNVMPNNGREVELKFPFELKKTDVINASKIDARIAGFGPMFSGALLASFVILFMLVAGRGDKKLLRNTTFIIIIIVISVLINPESWWARYVPQLWFLPIILLITAEFYKMRRSRILRFVIYGALLVNIGLTSIGIGWNFTMTQLINYQLEVLKASKQPIVIDLEFFNSNRIRLAENNISYVEKNLYKVKKNTVVIVHSSAKFIQDTTVNIPKSKFIKWAEPYQRIKLE